MSVLRFSLLLGGNTVLPTVLKLIAPVFLVVGCLHLVLGINAEVLLGANIGAEVLTDPVVDSQDRFYGVAFCY
jgi:hypothetical protein